MSVRLASNVRSLGEGTEGSPFPRSGTESVPSVPKIVPSVTWENALRSHNVPITFPAQPSPFPSPVRLWNRRTGTKGIRNVPREHENDYRRTTTHG